MTGDRRVLTAAAQIAACNGLRVWAVLGDCMAPTLRSGDLVLVAPVEEYVGEGIYLVGIPRPDLCRACGCAAGTIRLWHDNRLCGKEEVTAEWFRSNVVARVVYGVNHM